MILNWTKKEILCESYSILRSVIGKDQIKDKIVN